MGSKPSPPTNSPARVLVVDDDPAICHLIGKRLEAAGYQTLTSEGGEGALAALRSGGIDMVLLDIMMPGLDGFAALRSIRERHAQSSLPVIMVSARNKGEDVIEALRLGANDYIVKPIDFALLLKRVEAHLSLRRGAGKQLGGYRLLRKLGAGGMGVVFEAEDVVTGRPAAVKVLPRSLTVDEALVRRFLMEAELASRVAHPNVVRIFGAGRDDETFYIAMELVHGRDLGSMTRSGPLALPWAVHIARQVAAGLSALKGVGVIHRDIKPENVLVTSEGVAKISDFGIARATSGDERLTDDGVGVGSVLYASPEQIRGGGDYRNDIYSLGCTLFFMITGSDPFVAGGPVDRVLSDKTRNPPRLTQAAGRLTPATLAVIRRMLAPSPERRYSSFTEVDAALESILRPPRRVGIEPARLGLWAVLAAAGLMTLLVLWRWWDYG